MAIHDGQSLGENELARILLSQVEELPAEVLDMKQVAAFTRLTVYYSPDARREDLNCLAELLETRAKAQTKAIPGERRQRPRLGLREYCRELWNAHFES